MQDIYNKTKDEFDILWGEKLPPEEEIPIEEEVPTEEIPVEERVPVEEEVPIEEEAPPREKLDEISLKEAAPSQIPRHVARSAARIIETAVGMPADIMEFIESGTKRGFEAITKKRVPEISIRKILFPGLKTTEEIKELEKKAVGEYLEPKTDREKASDNFLSLFTALAMPGIGVGSILRAARGAAVAIALQLGAKALNMPESVQGVAGLVGTFAATKKPPSTKALYTSLYKKANNLIPRDTYTFAGPLKNSLVDLAKIIKPGIETPVKKIINNVIGKTTKLFKDGKKIKVEDLVELKKDLNEIINYQLPHGRKNLLKKLAIGVDKSIEFYGKRKNPEFLKTQRAADKLFKDVVTTEKTSTFLQALKGVEAGGLMAAFFTGNTHLIPAGIAGLGLTHIMGIILQRPALRRYYLRAMQSAVKQNKAGTLYYGNKLTKGLKKEAKAKDEFDILWEE